MASCCNLGEQLLHVGGDVLLVETECGIAYFSTSRNAEQPGVRRQIVQLVGQTSR